MKKQKTLVQFVTDGKRTGLLLVDWFGWYGKYEFYEGSREKLLEIYNKENVEKLPCKTLPAMSLIGESYDDLVWEYGIEL